MSEQDQWWSKDPIATSTGGKPITVAGGAAAPKPTEDQAKSAGFYGRAVGANGLLDKFDKDGLGPRTLIGQSLQAKHPDFMNSLPAAIGNSSDRQSSDQAQRDFINAILRRDSGAVIGDEEFSNYARLYFPSPGDVPATITQKATSRREAVEGLKMGAGPLAAQVEKNLAAPAPDPKHPGPGDIGFATGSLPKNFSPEQSTAYDAFMKANPKATADQIRSFVHDLGFSIDNADAIVLGREGGSGLAPGSAAVAVRSKPIDPGDGATGAAVRGAGDALTIGLMPRATALVQTVKNGTTYDSELARQQGIEAFDEQNHPYARFGGEVTGGLAGGFLLPGAGARTAGELARTGGGLGALYGVNKSQDLTNLPDVVKNGVLGGILGAGTGFGLGKLGERFIRPGAPPPRTPRPSDDIINAADRQNITVLPADVGGTGAKMATGAASMTLGGIPISEAAEKSVASAAAARNRMASMAGTPSTIDGVVDVVGAGQAAQRGAKSALKTTEERASALYDNIPIASDRGAVLSNTRQALSDLTQGLKSNAELSKLWAENPQLKATLDALTAKASPMMGNPALMREGQQIGTSVEGGALSWGDLKRFRSIIGEIAGKPSLADDGNKIAAMRKLYGALSEDMKATAAADGPASLKAFNRANDYWRGRESRVDNVLSSLLGNDLQKAPGAAFEQVNRWAQNQGGDFAKLSQALRSMPKDEAATVRATMIQRMGQASKGKQDAAGTVFSPAEFVTQWNSLSPRAKAVLFNNGGLRSALDDLATVTNGMKAAQKYENFSRTGNAVNGIALLSGFMTSPIATGMVAGSQLAMGKLLSSQALVNMLARSARQAAAGKPQADIINGMLRSIPSVATRSPAISGELSQFARYLSGIANDNAATVGRVAASPDERPEQQQ